ncbi:cuticle protein 19 [Dendroctonus ponderosae]|uniref:cuticle protein 19 n=1 Tax=Dendroctonus ponderosae TaxID=77166 RepID=UPI0020362C02|nr:cuticle protein 19 [Dendroctonus ponderosae]KAH1024739.1 hypothetical protein HUJ05_004182 [Dendroctonus ponderosae]
MFVSAILISIFVVCFKTIFVMSSVIFALLSLVSVCYAGVIYPEEPSYVAYEAPIYNVAAPLYEKEDHHAYPKYKFSYGVNDPHTGDHKSQEEYRDGDVVKGHYTVADPDGTLRVVHYTADDHNGFNAVVEKHGKSIHPQPIHAVPVIEKVVPVPVVKEIVYEKPYYGYGGHQGYGY